MTTCTTCGAAYGLRAPDCPHCRTHKTCPRCGEDKPMGRYPKATRRADSHQSVCAACGVVLRRTTQRDSDLYRKFGITGAEYDDIKREQGGVCAICEGQPRGGGAFHVDHDHATGHVRGLLCTNCNTGLGQFHDDAELLVVARAYLMHRRGDDDSDEAFRLGVVDEVR